MAPGTSTWSPVPTHRCTLSSRRHTLMLTLITPTRLWLLTTTRDAQPAITFPPYRSPPTAAPPSPASLTPAVVAPSPIPSATPLFSTTNRPALGSRSGSTGTAAVQWADTSPPTLRTRIAGPISAFTATAVTTESPVGPTTIQVLPTSGTCTFPGTTLIFPMPTSSSAAPRTTVSLGVAQFR